VRRLVIAVLVVGAVGVAAALADTKPDPQVQARPDGCQRNGTALYTMFAPNWVYVGDENTAPDDPPPAPQWVSGVVHSVDEGLLASRVATADNPITHRSYDVNIDVKADPTVTYLTGASRDGTTQQDHLHLERESASTPLFAWPAAGDRVSALGSWVWDCDHYQGKGERTELHPFRALWVQRSPGQPSSRSPRGESEGDVFVSTDGTPAAAQAECAHRSKGSDAYKACTKGQSEWQDVNGAYSFTLTAPPKPSAAAHLRVRVVDRGSVAAPPVRATISGSRVTVSFRIAAPRSKRVVVAKQVFAGWTPMPAAKLPVHLRLRFDSVLVRRAMDPSCRPDEPSCPARNETTLLGQIANGPGEYQLTWSVAGTWSPWSPRTLLARDGQTFRGTQSIDFWVPRGRPWTVVALARECDFGAVPSFAGPGVPLAPCPRTNEVGNPTGDDFAGAVAVQFPSPEKSIGRHVAEASTKGSSCPPANRRGCYRIAFTVSRVG
jgi:hypothetical protein